MGQSLGEWWLSWEKRWPHAAGAAPRDPNVCPQFPPGSILPCCSWAPFIPCSLKSWPQILPLCSLQPRGLHTLHGAENASLKGENNIATLYFPKLK